MTASKDDARSPGLPRRYRVSAVDELGDVHCLETDDAGRAEEMRGVMARFMGNARCDDRGAHERAVGAE